MVSTSTRNAQPLVSRSVYCCLTVEPPLIFRQFENNDENNEGIPLNPTKRHFTNMDSADYLFHDEVETSQAWQRQAAPGTYRTKRPHKKSRAGCFPCKARRVKVSLPYSPHPKTVHHVGKPHAQNFVSNSAQRIFPYAITARTRNSNAYIRPKLSNNSFAVKRSPRPTTMRTIMRRQPPCSTAAMLACQNSHCRLPQ